MGSAGGVLFGEVRFMRPRHALGWSLLVLLSWSSLARAQDGIRWETNLEAARQLAAETDRLLLLHFSASWCEPCQAVEQRVFAQPGFGRELVGDYVAVKLDFDKSQALARRLGVEQIPTDVIVTPQGQVVHRLASPQDPAKYVGALQQVAEGFRQQASDLFAASSGPTPQPAVDSAAPPYEPAAQSAAPAAPAPAPAGGASTAHEDRYADYFARRRAEQQGAAPAPQQAAPPAPQFDPAADQISPASASMPAPSYEQPAPSYVQQPAPAYAQQPGPRSQPAAPSQPAAAGPGAQQQGGVSLTGQQASAPQLPAGSPPLALDGYCAVTLVRQKKWIRGDVRYGAIHRGNTYLFASEIEQREFLAAPDSFSPVLSGYDPVLAADQSQAVPGQRRYGVFFEGRIFLFSSEETLSRFAQNPDQYASPILQASRAPRAQIR